jgi:hypothetical protein
MNSRQFQELQEAYMNVYQEIDEANRAEKELKLTPRQREISRNLRDKNTMTKPSRRKPDSDFYNPEKLIPRAYDNESDRWHDSMSQSRRLKRNLNKEEVDVYDVILSHLLDEGYASTEEAATAIMVNMSEEWRDSVVEGYVDWRKGSLTVPSRVKGNKRTQSPEERAGDSQFTKYADAQTTRGTQAVRGARGKKARLAAKQQEVIQKTTQNYNEKNKG